MRKFDWAWVGMVAALMAAQAAAQAPATPPETNAQRIEDLVVANHILADQGIVDGFGHISFRSVDNPKHFFMASSRAPALVTKDDILEFDENSEPVDARGRELYSERFIHGEIFRARPDVQSVVHSHTSSVLPFTVTKAPLKALIHTAGFLGVEPAPVFDIRSVEGPDNRMLVNNARSAAGLAKALGQRPVVLLRGHGMAVTGVSVRYAVMRAIYTAENARIEAEALKLGTPVFMNQFEDMRVDRITRQWEIWARRVEGPSARQ